MPARAALARSASSIELHALRSSRRSRKRKPAMDTERHTDVRGDSTSSVGEAAAPLSQPHAPGTSPVRPLERTHDGLRENAAPRLALETAMLAWPHLTR